MNRLKLTAGAAAACAACCALPLAVPAVLGTSIGAALWLCKDELLVATGVVLLSITVLWVWRRRQSRRPSSASPACGCEQAACSTEQCRPRA